MKRSEELKLELEEIETKDESMRNEIRKNVLSENYDKSFAEYWYKQGGKQAKEDIERLKWEIRKAVNHEIEIGDGVTLRLATDRNAYTVVKKTKETITIQRDKAMLDPAFKPVFVEGGFCAHCTNQDEQSYTYERDENGSTLVCWWSERLGAYQHKGCVVVPGRSEFYDYNF